MRVIVLLCLFLWPGFALAEEPTITVTVGDQTRIFTRDQLLARPDAATIQVPRDITYRVPLTYRAVPVASLLEGMTLPPNSIRSEQWPFQIAKLVSQPPPAARWPALAVDPGLPPTDPIRAGQALFVVPHLPQAEWSWRRRCRAGPQSAAKPDRIPDAAGLARSDPQPESCTHLACPGHAALSGRLSQRPRDWPRYRAYLKHMAGRKQPQ